MSDDRPTIEDAPVRISKALGLIDTWLRDESPHDGLRQQLVWKHLREIRTALSRCPHVGLYRKLLDTGGVYWSCEDCGRTMVVHRELTADEARRELDEEIR
ncbi:hypothetical protein [Nocardia wallacei]|uniref:hypothetical protein n=1 Tax=Nocardia wallacei TaxID=480035 RepID=UPI002455A0F8|nr:hypothetical protein [Nocardia wallacei]